MASAFAFDRKALNLCVMVMMGIILVIAGYASWKQYERHSRIKQEVAILEAEKERVRKENESLKERINYFATENFQEQESKERLNMRKDNEYVIDIEQGPGPKEADAKAYPLNSSQAEDMPNYKKWWNKIF